MVALPLKMHFSALSSLGPQTPIDTAVLAIPNSVGIWRPGVGYTLAGADVQEWAASDTGRVFQAISSTKRPTPDNGMLAFHNTGTDAVKAGMLLTGTALGTVTDITVAISAKLASSALNTDNHGLWGANDDPDYFNASYRRISSNNRMRLTYGTAATVLDADMPDGVATLNMYFRLAGGAATFWCNEITAYRAITEMKFPFFQIGGLNGLAVDWPGWIKKVGIWSRGLTKDEQKTVKYWLRA